MATLLPITIRYKQHKCPKTNEWVGQDVEYKHNGITLDTQKDKLMSFAAIWIELEGIMLS